MSRLRRHLMFLAVATLSVQTLLVAIGVARVCFPGAHTHAGVPVDDCPMHHHEGPQGPASHPAAHDTHAHGQPAEHGPDPRGMLTCRCATELPGLFTSAPGIVPAPSRVPVPLPSMLVAAGWTPFVLDMRLAPPSPPPRSRFSPLS